MTEQEIRENRRELMGALGAVSLLTALIIICSCLSGCVYKGAKVIEGTDLTVGMELPGSDGVAQINVLNYLSGFRLAVAKDAEMTCVYTSTWTNSYFGVVETVGEKTINATVTPVEVSSPCACGTNCTCGVSCKCGTDCKCAGNCTCGADCKCKAISSP